MREPYALKGARTVPGRGEGGNTLSLFDGGDFPLRPLHPRKLKNQAHVYPP